MVAVLLSTLQSAAGVESCLEVVDSTSNTVVTLPSSALSFGKGETTRM
jgi:hypothetical protein